jgi:hypothetical protein
MQLYRRWQPRFLKLWIGIEIFSNFPLERNTSRCVENVFFPETEFVFREVNLVFLMDALELLS